MAAYGDRLYHKHCFLDYLFVWVLPWGMMGAAIATAIGQAMTFLYALYFLS